jgi:hypothetical protein
MCRWSHSLRRALAAQLPVAGPIAAARKRPVAVNLLTTS